MTNEEYLKTMFQNNLFAIVYPKDKTQKSAEKLASMMEAAVGIAKIEAEAGGYVWGVLIDKTKVVKDESNDSSV